MKKTQKTNKRIIALVLAIITIFSVFAMTAVSAYAATDQESFPISSYPNGSYYTTTGTDCTSSHKYCKSYAGGKQCLAFAKYAYDKYSHRSEWTDISGDKVSSNKDISSETKAKAALQNLNEGTYVRITKSNGNGHSFIVKSTSSSGITVYDANWSSDNKYCRVNTHTITYSSLASSFATLKEAYCHTFSKYSQYNATYHKVACSSSGCTGYKLLTHIVKTGSDGVTKCSACGYIISIKGEEVASIGDEVASAGNEMFSASNEIASVDNETAPVGDEIAIADEETAVVNEEAMNANEETTTADEETTVAGEEITDTIEETTVADEETTIADEDTATTYNIAS